jgi:hypothetical protein
LSTPNASSVNANSLKLDNLQRIPLDANLLRLHQPQQNRPSANVQKCEQPTDQPDWEKTGQQIQQAQGKLVQIHTSGHVLPEDIVGFVNSLKPKTVVPVHTFEPQKFAKRFSNVKMLNDGEEHSVL